MKLRQQVFSLYHHCEGVLKTIEQNSVVYKYRISNYKCDNSCWVMKTLLKVIQIYSAYESIKTNLSTNRGV